MTMTTDDAEFMVWLQKIAFKAGPGTVIYEAYIECVEHMTRSLMREYLRSGEIVIMNVERE